MYDVVAIGELLIDFTCTGNDDKGYPTMAAHPGGAPANFLAALAKFGARTALLGKVGEDSFGHMLTATLKECGIDTCGLAVDPNYFTTLAFVTLDADGDREFSFCRKPGADTQLCWEELDRTLIDEAKVLHFGTLSLTDEPARTATKKAVEYARQTDKLISFDPNLRKPLWKNLEDARREMLWGLEQADVVKISDEEVEFLFGLDAKAGAEHLFEQFGVSLVYVTCGADGCWFKNANASGKVPGMSGLSVIDTTGAGDIFGGSAMWKLLCTHKLPSELEQSDLLDIVRFACTSAGLSTMRPGGIFSVPNLSEIEAHLS